MINKKELFLLNTILDNRDFFALPSMREMRLSPLLAESVYQSLIKKGILADKDNITYKGAELVKCMEEYKNAKRYVRLGTLVLGLYKKDFAIALIRNPLQGYCDFKRVNTVIDEAVIREMYPFVNREALVDTVSDEIITQEELKRRVSLGADNAIYMSSFDMKVATEDLQKATRNEIYFYDKGRFFQYNIDSSNLRCCMVEEIFSEIKERLCLHE